jgi:hypothetical protein
MKKKSKFLQRSFWLYPEDNPTEYFVLIEHDENHIPLGTIIVKVPKKVFACSSLLYNFKLKTVQKSQ